MTCIRGRVGGPVLAASSVAEAHPGQCCGADLSVAHQHPALAGVSGSRAPGVLVSTVWRILRRNGLKGVDDALEPGRR